MPTALIISLWGLFPRKTALKTDEGKKASCIYIHVVLFTIKTVEISYKPNNIGTVN
jgi:hypothetical protein